MTKKIPRIDIKNSDLVKGINLEGLRVLGKPEDYSSFYHQGGADELIFQDVVASLYESGKYLILTNFGKELSNKNTINLNGTDN